jgi:protein-glutamine gamma-glutamyltransferase
MIKIADEIVPPERANTSDPIGKDIANKLSLSSKIYKYDSIEQLEFEINLRLNIISSARQLNKSRFSFATFRESYCNSAFWNRTEEGGFRLKDGIKPSDAIKDMYIHSWKYGTECATAMVVVFYKAILNMYPEELFNDMFADIYLMNWGYLDKDLGISSFDEAGDFLPGDCRYFRNPDVNPEKPQWQGENVIDMGDGTYYGHGTGIRTAEKIITFLNKLRKAGATQSAYLLDSVTRPYFKYLGSRYLKYNADQQRRNMYRGHEYCRNCSAAKGYPFMLPVFERDDLDAGM